MGKKASAIGSFFGGIANNPGIVILGLALGGLLIFRKDITNFLDKGIGNITLPEIKLPDITFPEFNFPEFNFPEFPSFPDFSGIFQGFQDQLSSIAGQVVDLQGAQVTIPPDTTVNPDGTVTSTTPPTIDLGTQDDLSTLFGELRPQVFDTLINIGVSLPLATDILSGAKTFEDLQVILQQANTGIFTQLQGTLDILDQPVELPSVPIQPVSSFLLDDPQQFTGGGIGFIGGSIFETPIANLSLSQIIDMFNVTASQASNILAIAKDDFGDFDFGTNTGGLSLLNLPGLSGSNVSDPQFQGLTPQQIALFLTGGNIQNF